MTDQQQKALRLLGLARRARLLEIGEEQGFTRPGTARRASSAAAARRSFYW